MNNMIIKNILAAICALLGFVFGDLNGIMIALIALIVMDYISGVLAAVVEKKLSSEVGEKGIAQVQ